MRSETFHIASSSLFIFYAASSMRKSKVSDRIIQMTLGETRFFTRVYTKIIYLNAEPKLVSEKTDHVSHCLLCFWSTLKTWSTFIHNMTFLRRLVYHILILYQACVLNVMCQFMKKTFNRSALNFEQIFLQCIFRIKSVFNMHMYIYYFRDMF